MRFADVGELGWAMYLSAHVNWQKEQGNDCYVYTNRPAMFECKTGPVRNFKYWDHPADGFGRWGISDKQIRSCFKDLSDRPEYNCDKSIVWAEEKTVYRPYKVTRTYPLKYIAICPRYRKSEHHKYRNLPKEFYTTLINALTSDFYVITLGAVNGAYDIRLDHPKYINLIGSTTIEGLINSLSSAMVCIGGTSAPPKMAALQGTPTYVIGHERKRFTENENWSGTDYGFFDVEDYQDFDYNACIADISDFIKTHDRG